MKKIFASIRTVFVLAGLIVWAAMSPMTAVSAEQGSASSRISLEGALEAGQPVKAVFALGDYQIPVGAYTSVNISVVSGPEGAKPVVQSGYPASTLTFPAAGDYVIQFVVNEVRKPSCAGVVMTPLLEERKSIRIK